MIRLIAGFIGWFGLGVIIAEVFNNFQMVSFQLNPILTAASLALVYVILQVLLGHLAGRAAGSTDEAKTYRKLFAFYQVLLAIIGIGGLISIPFLWWGVIKRLAVSANEGIRLF